MKIWLAVADGPHKGKEIAIKLPQFIIGRDPQCQLRPASSMISRRHCAILVRQGRVYLRDFGSTNGTVVNGTRVEGEIELHDQDRITIDPLAFTFNVKTEPASAQAPAKPAADAEDDSIAALLLEVEEGGAGGPLTESGVPTGSTVLQMQALPQEENAENPPEETKPAEGKAEKAKAEQASTSAAAKLLLEKYARRRRP
jgi:predicted component of type VI protein secretion system